MRRLRQIRQRAHQQLDGDVSAITRCRKCTNYRKPKDEQAYEFICPENAAGETVTQNNLRAGQTKQSSKQQNQQCVFEPPPHRIRAL